MKILLRTLLVLAFFSVQSTFAAVSINSLPNQLTIDVAHFTAKDFQVLTGKKMTLRARIAYKFTQRELAHAYKMMDAAEFQKRVSDGDKSFNWGGFLLGFFLSIIGVLIALLFGRNVVRWAVRGFLVSLVVGVISYLVSQ